jgi:hypothetical protein
MAANVARGIAERADFEKCGWRITGKPATTPKTPTRAAAEHGKVATVMWEVGVFIEAPRERV